MRNLFWLTEAQVARMEPYFPKSHGKPRVDGRRVLRGITFVNRNGLRWRDARKEYSPPKTLYNRWKRWSEQGVFARVMEGLASEEPEKKTGLSGWSSRSRSSRRETRFSTAGGFFRPERDRLTARSPTHSPEAAEL